MHQRAFVLQPLQDLGANLTLNGKTLQDLLADCSDQSIALLTELTTPSPCLPFSNLS
jgi:7,8-dihydro-6-hydroxymethylpterin-pyrophosphokinase